jgi:hypothetical protein
MNANKVMHGLNSRVQGRMGWVQGVLGTAVMCHSSSCHNHQPKPAVFNSSLAHSTPCVDDVCTIHHAVHVSKLRGNRARLPRAHAWAAGLHLASQHSPLWHALISHRFDCTSKPIANQPLLLLILLHVAGNRILSLQASPDPLPALEHPWRDAATFSHASRKNVTADTLLQLAARLGTSENPTTPQVMRSHPNRWAAAVWHTMNAPPTSLTLDPQLRI